MSLFKQSESTASRRWIRFRCFDDDSGDNYAPKTGLSFSSGELKIAKPGQADANAAGYASVVEAGHGRYWYPLSAGELDTIGECSLVVNKADVFADDAVFQVVPWDPYDANGLGLSRIDAPISTRLPTASYQDIAEMLAVADTIRPGWSLLRLFRTIGAVLAGKTSGAGTGMEYFREVDDSAVRVTSTNVGKNRTNVSVTED